MEMKKKKKNSKEKRVQWNYDKHLYDYKSQVYRILYAVCASIPFRWSWSVFFSFFLFVFDFHYFQRKNDKLLSSEHWIDWKDTKMVSQFGKSIFPLSDLFLSFFNLYNPLLFYKQPEPQHSTVQSTLHTL